MIGKTDIMYFDNLIDFDYGIHHRAICCISVHAQSPSKCILINNGSFHNLLHIIHQKGYGFMESRSLRGGFIYIRGKENVYALMNRSLIKGGTNV